MNDLFRHGKSFWSRKKTGSLWKFLIPAAIPLLLLGAAGVWFLSGPRTEDQRFRSFTRQLFCQEVGANTLNLHYTLADPAAYGIDSTRISLGTMEQSAWEASSMQAENCLSALEGFSREELSPQNRLTYDVLRDYLRTRLEGTAFYLYDEPLSPTLGIQAQLPVLLAEYPFRTKGDIETYLQLLTAIPEYFQSIIDFEKEKAQAGLFMSDASVSNILRQCDAFLSSKDDNYLRQLFDQQIDSFSNLTIDEKISYKQQNQDILNAYVMPAYENLMKELANLLGSGKNTGGLYYLPQGKEYYAWLVKSTTGDDSGIEAIEERIRQEIVQVSGEVQTLLSSDHGLTSISLDEYESQEPAEIISSLQQMITRDFPEAPQVSCQIKYVHDSLQDYLSPAFYLTPAIDDTDRNVIYINPASDYNALELYTTLAHEGYPGHLYQTVLFEENSDEPLRSILNYGGYTEGWATYVEMYAYSTWTENTTLAAIYQKDRSLMLGLASFLDIGIHYRGYTRNQVAEFLAKFGIGREASDALYTNIVEAPANYLKYYVGYLNFLDLGEYLEEQLQDQFSLKEYHARVLAIGPCSFTVLKHYLTDPDYLRWAA